MALFNGEEDFGESSFGRVMKGTGSKGKGGLVGGFKLPSSVQFCAV